MFKSLPPTTAWTSAFIAAMIGFGGTVTLVVQAMHALGASVELTSSAVTSLCLGIALAGIILSFYQKIPIVLAWPTPGAALLAATTPGFSWPVIIGSFITCGLLMVCLGAIPALGKLAEKIPSSIASAMLAGVLLPFCLKLFQVGNVDPILVMALLVVFLVARQRIPLYALLLVLFVGISLTIFRGNITELPEGATLGILLPTLPSFDLRTIISIGVPLFLVTLVSQNIPGLVVLRAAGYKPKPRLLLAATGLTTILLAPFGAFAICLAAITAAICINSDAHPDKDRRWTVGVLYGGMYLILALFSPLLVRFFLALPIEVIAALTGIALITALINALETSLAIKEERDAAIVTFLAAGSGLTLFGLGAAFWGLVAGFLALAIKTLLHKKK